MDKCIDYVLGFVICAETKEVVLLRKEKLEFQKGFYNGIGGKIEEYETANNAISRETKEEIGLDIKPEGWIYFCKMSCNKDSIDKVSKAWTIRCFIVDIPKEQLVLVRQMEIEEPLTLSLSMVGYTNFRLLGR